MSGIRAYHCDYFHHRRSLRRSSDNAGTGESIERAAAASFTQGELGHLDPMGFGVSQRKGAVNWSVRPAKPH
jgi:hypothetical protein